jgi:hypothetical protein
MHEMADQVSFILPQKLTVDNKIIEFVNKKLKHTLPVYHPDLRNQPR